MKPKVSIIIPIYNMEKYLSRCLQSVLEQTLQEIEIIAVNDGSTDNSLQILKQYSEKDARIIVVNQENKGVSAARNAGIDMADSEYIGFVDPDDWINENMYKEMYEKAMNYKAQVVMCSYIREFQTHSKEKTLPFSKLTFLNEEKIKKEFLRKLIGPINSEVSNPEMLDAYGTVWSKIYRTQLIKDNCLSFVDLNEIGTNEDTLFNIEVFQHTTSFLILNESFYHYWKENTESVTSNYKKDLHKKWSVLYDKLDTLIKRNNVTTDYSLALKNRVCIGVLGLGLNLISDSNDNKTKEKLKILKNILQEKKTQESFQTFDLQSFALHWKMFYFFAKRQYVIPYYVLLCTINLIRKKVR